MEIRIERDTYTNLSSTGKMSIDGAYFCVTLEPPVHDGPKVQGRTAIPEGRYPVKLIWSPHFQKNTPHVLNVPDFSEIEIHVGNFPNDTEGCTLVGNQRGRNCLWNSTTAWDQFMARLEYFWKQNPGGEVWATYTNLPAPGQTVPEETEAAA